MMFEMKALLALGGFLAANFLAASSGAFFKPDAWYEGLEKPSWTPPNWAFPVVWTALFLLNAIAGWLVWQTVGQTLGQGAVLIFAVYGASLVINAAWSALFFGRKRMDWALVDVVALAVSIAVVMALFAPINGLAALMLIPYLAWVCTAALLNFRMVQLNPR